MPATDMNALLPFLDRSQSSTIKVEGKAQRESASLFGEVLDTVNPLQHVPGVSEAYRAVTKDKISEGAKLAGHIGFGAALGGPVGAVIGAGVFVIEGVIGALFGRGKKSSEQLVQAENVKQGPKVLTNEQALHPGKMRGNTAAIPMQAQKHFAAPAPLPAQKQRAEAPPAPSLGTAAVDMSSAQFAALLGAFGGTAPAAAPADRDDDRSRPNSVNAAPPIAPSGGINSADFAARMAANLDKLDSLKRGDARP